MCTQVSGFVQIPLAFVVHYSMLCWTQFTAAQLHHQKKKKSILSTAWSPVSCSASLCSGRRCSEEMECINTCTVFALAEHKMAQGGMLGGRALS